MMESLVPEFDAAQFVRERTGNVMPGITPSNTYTTRDGKHLIIGANGDAIFQRLMRAIGRVDLADAPDLANNAGRDKRAKELYGVIGDWVAGLTEAEVLAVTSTADVPASRIFSVADMFTDPQFIARGMIEAVAMADGRSLRVPGIVPKLSASPGATDWLGPSLGADTNQVLESLGFTAVEISALRKIGAI
jgi:formyl-CoA transferase